MVEFAPKHQGLLEIPPWQHSEMIVSAGLFVSFSLQTRGLRALILAFSRCSHFTLLDGVILENDSRYIITLKFRIWDDEMTISSGASM